LNTLLCILLSKSLFAQPCNIPTATIPFKCNAINTIVSNDGVFYPDINLNNSETFQLSFTNGLWIGGKNKGLLHTAATMYRTVGWDFSAGPLDPKNGATSSEECHAFDKIWIVSRTEIEQFQQDVADGTLNQTHPAILAWPAKGNPFFEQENGFINPFSEGLFAPFFDTDSDGFYNPSKGDFPLPEGVDEKSLPDQIAWSVMNDVGNIHTLSKGGALHVEVQQTVWGYHSDKNTLLDNSLFYRYKIINRGTETIDTLYSSLWADVDNCFDQDYIGSVPAKNAFFAYSIKDPINNFCKWYQTPPVLSYKLLNHPLHSFIVMNRAGVGAAPLPTIDPRDVAEFYSYMQGRWKDDSPITVGGYGYKTDAEISKFMFPDHPKDTSGWSVATSKNIANDRRGLANVYLDHLNVGEAQNVDFVITNHVGKFASVFDNLDTMYQNLDKVQKFYDTHFKNLVMGANEVIPEMQTANPIEILGSVFNQQIVVKNNHTQPVMLEMVDILGRVIKTTTIASKATQEIPTIELLHGLYFIRATEGTNVWLKKVVK
jgi:hypothetical protein